MVKITRMIQASGNNRELIIIIGTWKPLLDEFRS